MFKKFLVLFLTICLCFVASCGKNNDNDEDESSPSESSDESQFQDKLDITDDTKVLVAYFSRAGENYSVGDISKGNTQKLAEFIASELEADIYRIEPVIPYPDEYDECVKIAKQEKEENARPKILGSVENMDEYDIIFLGYPIWHTDMPMAVYTFLESYDFSGKTIVTFNTHEGSGNANTTEKLSSILPNTKVVLGFVMYGSVAQELNAGSKNEIRYILYSLGF